MNDQEKPKSWKQVTAISDAKKLIDLGVLLTRDEVKILFKAFSEEEIGSLVRYIANRFAERLDRRLAVEILAETLLHVLVHRRKEDLINHFLEEILLHPHHHKASLILTELTLIFDYADSDYGEKLFSTAVALICELGMAVMQIEQQYPGELNQATDIVHHISTYLLSVSNSSNPCIRLSLVRYFGFIEKGIAVKPGFNRIMNRFGHTVLESLFSQLFDKKTEGVALQFLLSNLPSVLEADNHTQNILHGTLKFYMLKKPARFSLFINTFSRHLKNLPDQESQLAMSCFLKHLGTLTSVASNLNHIELGRDIFTVVACLKKAPFYSELVDRIRSDQQIRASFIHMLEKILATPRTYRMSEPNRELGRSTRNLRRGRRPSFTKIQKMKPLDQVSFLGERQVAKAS